jgi:hypothetical protein
MKPTVFVSSSKESLPLVNRLRDKLSEDAKVVSWADVSFSLAQPVLTQFSQSLADSDFVVALIDFSKVVRTPGGLQAPRDNIIFELGMLIGSLGPERVLIVDTATEPGSSWMPSNLAGLSIMRGAGGLGEGVLLNDIATQVRKGIRDVEPKQGAAKAPYSCFISYSPVDHIFASKLFEDLSAIGARCWLGGHELRAGELVLDQLALALQTSDKFIPVCSQTSLQSRWFELELRTALDIEAKRSKTVVMPIRIDDFVLSTEKRPWVELSDRLIGDFRDWRSGPAYNRAFRQLALDLAASVSQDRAQGKH